MAKQAWAPEPFPWAHESPSKALWGPSAWYLPTPSKAAWVRLSFLYHFYIIYQTYYIQYGLVQCHIKNHISTRILWYYTYNWALGLGLALEPLGPKAQAFEKMSFLQCLLRMVDLSKWLYINNAYKIFGFWAPSPPCLHFSQIDSTKSTQPPLLRLHFANPPPPP